MTDRLAELGLGLEWLDIIVGIVVIVRVVMYVVGLEGVSGDTLMDPASQPSE